MSNRPVRVAMTVIIEIPRKLKIVAVPPTNLVTAGADTTAGNLLHTCQQQVQKSKEQGLPFSPGIYMRDTLVAIGWEIVHWEDDVVEVA